MVMGFMKGETTSILRAQAGMVMVQGVVMSAFKVQGHLPRLSDVEPRGSMTMLIEGWQLYVPCAWTSLNAGVFDG